ncbi:MAG TPA: glycosyltransferase family 1 protein [Cyclobacteriaceae bacterium]
MKRIGIFVSVAFGAGGMFQYCQQLVAAMFALPQDKFRITIFYVDEKWSSILPSGNDSYKVNFTRKQDNFLKVLFRLRIPDVVIRWLFSLTDLKQISKSDLALVIFPSQDLAGIFLTPRSINVIHDLMHRYEPQFKESSGMGRGAFRDRLFGSFANSSMAMFVDSEVGKHQMMESYGADAKKISVLPYIAPGHISKYDDSSNGEYFNKLGLSSKFLFYPAQFWAHKNHKILIEAAKILKNQLPDLRIYFIGPQNHAYGEIFDSVQQNELTSQISFIDYVPNEVLGGFYLRARAMVMPTHYGPTNIPPLEAIALGCPVAVSNIYGMPAQLGNAALYFNNKDARDVATVIKRLWTDDELCMSLKRNAKAHFANWSQPQFNQKFYEMITHLLQQEVA